MTKMTETLASGRSIGILAFALLCAGCGGGTPAPGGSGTPPAPAQPPAAQEVILPPLATCPPSGFNTTVIELADTGGVCAAVTTGADKFDTIYTAWGDMAYWDICNRCSQRVDIKLRRYSGELTDDFDYTIPMAGASNEIELLSVGRYPSLGALIRGRLKSDARDPTSRTYEVSWRITGTLLWTDIDPRLEIERDHFALANRLVQTFKPPSGGRGGRGRGN
jgi:hypothetical protein